MARTLIVLRHAKSTWRTDEPDIRRPLAQRGIIDATAAGGLLAEHHLDLVLCSSATRAQQTWQHAAAGGASCSEVRVSEAIYHAWTAELLLELNELDDEVSTVLLIGHQPTLSDLVATLAEPSPLRTAASGNFPTCAMAVLTYRGGWPTLAEGCATLKDFQIPRG